MKTIAHNNFKEINNVYCKKIPTEWQPNIKIGSLAKKSVGSFTNGPFGSDLLTSEIMESGVPIIYIRDIAKGKYQRVSKAFVTPEKAKQLNVCNVESGDVLIAKVGDPPGISAVYPEQEENAIITQDVIRIKPNSKVVNNYYLSYFLNSAVGKAIIEQITVESTRSRISLGDFKAIKIFLPLKNEQDINTEYLDTKTQAIEQKIELLKTKKNEYLDLRKALINETITKGLNPDIELKDSEIEWLDEIPEHWQVRRIKDVAIFYNGFAFNSNEYQDEGIPIIRIGDIQSVIDTENARKVSSGFLQIAKDARIIKNDILIAMTGATIGKSSIFVEEEEMLLNQRVGMARCNKAHFGFLFYIVQSAQFLKYIQILCGGSAQENISKYQIENFWIQYPPIAEQKQIAEYLDTKTSQIEKIIANIKKQLDALDELKKTLINDVVTGKVKVVE